MWQLFSNIERLFCWSQHLCRHDSSTISENHWWGNSTMAYLQSTLLFLPWQSPYFATVPQPHFFKLPCINIPFYLPKFSLHVSVSIIFWKYLTKLRNHLAINPSPWLQQNSRDIQELSHNAWLRKLSNAEVASFGARQVLSSQPHQQLPSVPQVSLGSPSNLCVTIQLAENNTWCNGGCPRITVPQTQMPLIATNEFNHITESFCQATGEDDDGECMEPSMFQLNCQLF